MLRRREDLERAGYVKALDAGEGEDRDDARERRGGTRDDAYSALVRKDRFPTIPAMRRSGSAVRSTRHTRRFEHLALRSKRLDGQ